MDEPPVLLDGARVLQYALLDAKVKSTGRMSVVVGGTPLDLHSVVRLVIAEDLVEGGVFLLHCNADWETLAAEHYPDSRSARRTSEIAYSGIEARWAEFRELTPAEASEVETTRSFLRSIAEP